jgi:hypothetical protein
MRILPFALGFVVATIGFELYLVMVALARSIYIFHH